MYTREQLDELINTIRDSLEENTSALLSDNFLNITTNYQLALDKISELEKVNSELQNTNEELLKVNGKLFQKIGVEETKEEKLEEKLEEKELDINNLINEKGEII